LMSKKCQNCSICITNNDNNSLWVAQVKKHEWHTSMGAQNRYHLICVDIVVAYLYMDAFSLPQNSPTNYSILSVLLCLLLSPEGWLITRKLYFGLGQAMFFHLFH
jgi:hypothetical protein